MASRVQCLAQGHFSWKLTVDRRTTNRNWSEVEPESTERVTCWAKVNDFLSWWGSVCNRVYDHCSVHLVVSLKISALSVQSAMTTSTLAIALIFAKGDKQNPKILLMDHFVIMSIMHWGPNSMEYMNVKLLSQLYEYEQIRVLIINNKNWMTGQIWH